MLYLIKYNIFYIKISINNFNYFKIFNQIKNVLTIFNISDNII